MWQRLKSLFSRSAPISPAGASAGQSGSTETAGQAKSAGDRRIWTAEERQAHRDKVEQERRHRTDRRSDDRRLDERRKAGIGEIIPDRRTGPRRNQERREGSDRRDD